jgi:hypothetical protein
MDDVDGVAMLGLLFGLGLALWATVGGGGPGMGVFAALLLLASAVWFGVSFF